MEVTFGANEQATPVQEAEAAKPVIEAEVVKEQVTPTPAATAPAPTMAVAVVPPPQVPVQYDPAPVLGDYIPDFNDIILPRLNIVQNIGTLKESFQPGELTFGQQIVLFTPPRVNSKTGAIETQGTKPVTLTIIGFKMPIRFVEKIVGGVRGLIVNSEEEVRKAGGTLDYNEWNLKKEQGMKRFEPLAEALCAVERPEHCPDDGTTFVYSVGDKKYAFCWWAMKGTIYTEAAKRVFFTARRTGCLIKGYPCFSYSVSVTEKPYPNGHKAWIPVCLPKEKNSPEFLALVKDFLNPTPCENAAPDAPPPGAE